MANERKIVKKVDNCVLYSDGTIRVDNVRASYPFIGKARAGENDDGKETSKFGIACMLPKSTHTAAKNLIKEHITALITEAKAKVPTDKWFLINGDDKEQEEYADHFILSTSESKRPSARHRDGSSMTPDEAADIIYGGCYVNVLIRPWYFAGKGANGKTYPKRICCGIVAVQFVRDGEPFGDGRVSDEGVFGAIDGDDDDNNDDGL